MSVSPLSGTTSLAAAPIGGQYISSFGGVIGVTPYVGNRTLESSPTYLLDCKNWSLSISNITDDTTHTGSFGAQGADVTAQIATFNASVVWDLRTEPDLFVRGGYFTMSFNVGCRMSFFLGDNANYPSDAGASFWYVPSMKIQNVTPILDANGKKMISAVISGVANSRVYRLANYNTPSPGGALEAPLLKLYLDHLATRNLVF